MATNPRTIIEKLPKPIRRGAETVRVMAALGVFSDPLKLVKQWRHRAEFQRLQKALFYHRYASALLLANEVGLFAALEKGGRTIEQTAGELGVNPRAAEALLRILESEGAVERHGRRYQLSPFGAAYLAPASTFSVSPMLDLMAAQAFALAEVPRCMKSGGQPKVLDIFSKRGRYRDFLAAVNAFVDLAGRDLLQQADLPEVKDFIVGSMGVSMSALLLERFPEAKVTYGCLAHLVREIPRLREDYAVPANRVTGMHAHGGDPSADRWGGESYDLVFLTKKMILEPEQRMGEKFAAKAFEVLRPGGAVVLWETIHTDFRPTPLPRAMEAVMDLIASPTGLVNTENGVRSTLETIGYKKVEIVPCLGGQTTFVIARKPG